ncbi:hypothetical protein, partial [Klebsiella pneumoniae]
MIIRNGARCSWQYRLRDLLILLVTWIGWLFLALQPWLNYLDKGEGDSFIGSLDAQGAGQLFLALLLGIFLHLHLRLRQEARDRQRLTRELAQR